QAVQRSAFPDAYAQHEDMARAFASALTGNSPAALDCRLHEADTGDLAGFSTRFAADFSDLEARPVNREGADAAPARQKQIAISIPDDADAGADGGDAEADDAGAGAAGEDTQPDGADKQPDVRMWAVANWAVAVADSYGIVAVDAGGQQWTRDEPWAPSDVPEAGNVLITFAPQYADCSLAILNRRNITLRVAGVNLARTADLGGGVLAHFLPLCDPAGQPAHHKQRREHCVREAHCLVNQTGVEIHVRVELAFDEVFVIERYFF